MKFTQEEIDYLRDCLARVDSESAGDIELDESVNKKLDEMEEDLEDEG
jgi:hypothetical protein